MPAVSEKQRRAMYAAAEGKSRLGIPKDVGEEFVGKRKDALAQSIMDAISAHFRADDDKAESVTELDVAKAIRDGDLSSPQRFGNLWLFDVRVTGTGTSYRTALDEYVYRPPEDFLSDDFVERCNGLPVVFEHPKGGNLDTDEYRQRAIGTITLPYVKGDEVWGIAKIYDEDAAALMQTTHVSTSPMVMFRKADNLTKIDADDGKSILIEGKPSYLDHLAICEEGVWDKGGEPKGVNLNEESAMSDETMPGWADELGKRLDAACSRLDAIEAGRKDSFEGLEKKVEGEGYDKEAAEKIAGKVAAEKGETGKRKDESEAEREGAEEERDEHKAAAEIEAAGKEGEKERHAEARSDAEDEKRKDEEVRMDAQAKENADLKRRIAEMDARMTRLMQPLSANDRDELALIQKRADSLAQMFGDSITPPLAGETPIEYRKRMAAKFQKYSDSTKGIQIEKLDSASFNVIEDRIYTDAQSASTAAEAMPAGRLFPVHSTDRAGRTITKYHGDPKAWMAPFMAKGLSVRIADSATRRGAN